MQINKEADFVLKGNKVLHPPVRTDGLELYYDTKGKKNTDLYKNRMLDMSGNDRHGELQSFSYKNLSGYQEDSQLVFDGIDDKLVLGDVEKPEIVSATKNLFDKDHHSNRDNYDFGAYSVSKEEMKLKPNTEYTLSYSGLTVRAGYWAVLNLRQADGNNYFTAFNINAAGRTEDAESGSNSHTFTTDSTGSVRFRYYDHNSGKSPEGVNWFTDVMSNAQLEEGSTATPYVPYIPSIRGTYQINNNIISYDGDTVRWTKDGKVMERKGINLIQNGNFWNGINGWTGISGRNTIHSYNNILIHTVSVPAWNEWIRLNNQPFSFKEGNNYLYSIEYKHPDETVLTDWRIGGVPNASSTIRESVGDGYKKATNIVVPGRESKDSYLYMYTENLEVGEQVKLKNAQIIDLTATFGAGNEPTLEEIQAEPDKWQWIPNPIDLVEAEELKGNILGDMEDIIDDHARDEQSGIEVFTDKADDSVVHVEVDGKSYQYAGSGKNLIQDGKYGSYIGGNVRLDTMNGITRINDTYKTNGAPKDLIGFIADISTGKITVSGESNSNRIMYYYSLNQTTQGQSSGALYPINGKFSLTIDIQETDATTIHIGLGEFPYVNDYSLSNIQIEKGSTATAYEPPAPTPDYPIEIHSLNDFDVVSQKSGGGTIDGVEVGGKNLLLGTSDESKTHTFSMTWGDFVSDDRNRNMPIKEGETYTFRVWLSNKSSSGNNVRVMARLMVAESQSTTRQEFQGNIIKPGSEGFSEVTFTVPKGFHFLHPFSVRAGLSGLSYEVNYQYEKLEKGHIATDWAPAPEDITESDNHPLIDKINFSLSEPLRSVGDVKDRLFRDSDGLWKVERNVREVLFDGSETWTHQVSSNHFYRSFSDKNRDRQTPVMSSSHVGYWESRSYPSYDNVFSFYGNTNIGFKTDGITTQQAWKDKIASMGGLTLLYTINPIIETLQDELQDKLNNLRSFQDSNYVYTIINDKADILPSHISENLKPTIHTEFLAHDHYKESRTVNNLLIWNRALEDEELLNQNKLFHERFNMKSNTIKGEPITQTINLTQGGYAANTLSLEYTIEI